jgi:hypothetical protein
MTHPRYGGSLLNLIGQLTNARCSDGAPEPDGVIKVVSDTFMMTFFVFYSYMLTVKYRLYLTTYRFQHCGDIELAGYLANAAGPVPLVLDLRIALLPPRTLILDFTMTHPRYGGSLLNLIGQLTNARCSDGVPEPDGVIKVVSDTFMMTFFRTDVVGPGPPHRPRSFREFF